MKEIVDAVWDSIALGRKSVRVVHKRPEIETGETYLISFLLNLDKAVHDEIVAEATRQRREGSRCLFETTCDMGSRCVSKMQRMRNKRLENQAAGSTFSSPRARIKDYLFRDITKWPEEITTTLQRAVPGRDRHKGLALESPFSGLMANQGTVVALTWRSQC
jgi:hypothetical protein